MTEEGGAVFSLRQRQPSLQMKHAMHCRGTAIIQSWPDSKSSDDAGRLEEFVDEVLVM